MINVGAHPLLQKLNKGSNPAPKGSSIEFQSPLPKGLEGRIVQLKVEKVLGENLHQLTLPNGKKIEAKITPPLPQGSTVKVAITQTNPPKLTEIELPQTLPKQTLSQNTQSKAQKNTASTANTPQSAAANTNSNPIQNEAQKNIRISTVQPEKQGHIGKKKHENTGEKPHDRPHAKPTQSTTPKAQPAQVGDTLKLQPSLQIKTTEFQLKNLIGEKLVIRSMNTDEQIQMPKKGEAFSAKIISVSRKDGFQTLQPLSQKLPLMETSFKAEIPQKTELMLKITNSSQAEVLQASTQKNDLDIKLQAQIKPQAVSPIQTKNIKIVSSDIEIPVGKELKGVIVSTSQAGQKFEHTVQLNDGVRFNIQSTQLLKEGEPMAIRLTADGVTEVLKLVGEDRAGQQFLTKKSNTGAQNSPPASNKPTFTPGSIHVGIVTAQSEKGQHTLTFPQGQKLEVIAQRNLPVGAHVTITITDSGEAEILNLTLPSGSLKTTTLVELSSRWEGLHRALQVLQQDKPEAAKSLLDRLPNLGRNFLPAFLLFSEAIATENLSKVFGEDTINFLRSLGIDFTSEVNGLNQLQQKTDTPDGWRSIIFPYIGKEGEDPQQGSFYWRNQDSDNDEKHLRFVINMSLSSFGATQLDGLMHEKELFFKLRTHNPLTENSKIELQDLVKKALEALELTGGISIQTTQNFEIDPLHEMLKAKEQLNVTI